MIPNVEQNQKPLLPFLKWAGGKRWLTSTYSDLFPDNYNRYIEPFVGSAAVFFHLQPEKAILADANPDLINTYISIKDNWKEVEQKLKIHHKHHCKNYYYAIRESQPRTETGRAAKFIYLNRTCWNGLYRVNLKGEFNVPIGTKSSVILNSDNFEGISSLLKGKRLVCSDFEKIINMAEKDDFVFIDPPYTVKHNNNGFVKYNESIFSWKDQERLRNAIKRATTRGVKILMTNAYHNCIKDLYKGVGKQIKLSRSSVISGNADFRGKYEELIITNW